MALALFAELHVRDFQAAKPWYVQLLGEPSFAAHDNGVRKITFHDPDGNQIGFGGMPG